MSYSRVRRRFVPHIPGVMNVGINDIRLNQGAWQAATVVTKTFSSTSRLSEDTCIDSTHPGPPYNSGGPVNIFHYWNPLQDIRGVGTYLSGTTGLQYRYRGGFLPSASMMDAVAGITQTHLSSEAVMPGSVFPSRVSTTVQGTAGWKKFQPGQPVADLGVFVGEFKDVPRMLKTTAKGFHDVWRSMGGSKTSFGPRKVADHWLNTQFGWFPFLSDLRKFHKAYVAQDAYLKRLRTENGHWVRRGGTVATLANSEVVRSSPTATGHWPALPTGLYVSPTLSGSHTVTRTTTDHSWFSAAFRYWIPDVDSVLWQTRALTNLYGALPCPSLVWELTPWSWLVDWFSNVGDVISNLSINAVDNLAAKYAYVMRMQDVTADLESFHYLKSASLHDTWTFNVCWKNRTGASPYGFGLTDSDLTVRQWSILSALGITHAH